MEFTPLKFIDTPQAYKGFLVTLRQRVDSYFSNHHISKKANFQMVIKSVVMVFLYIVPFLLYVAYHPAWYLSLFLWGLMSLGLSGIGMCIMHDANHSAYFHSHIWNHRLGKIINIIGGSAFNWKIQHNILHHTYTNIAHYDDDIDDKAILKLSPYAPSKWYHKFQHIYAFAFYGIATLYWCTVKDFIQLVRYTKEGLNKNNTKENIYLWIQLVVSKIIYFSAIFYIPYFFGHIPMSETILYFLFMHFIGGLILTTVFQLAHTVDGTMHPLPNENNIIEQDWAVHQMETTMDFSRKNKWISWYVGGLNFQVEHHLFPNICHVHYPAISDIVKSTAAEYKISYLEYHSVWDALQGHIKALKKFSN